MADEATTATTALQLSLDDGGTVKLQSNGGIDWQVEAVTLRPLGAVARYRQKIASRRSTREKKSGEIPSPSP